MKTYNFLVVKELAMWRPIVYRPVSEHLEKQMLKQVGDSKLLNSTSHYVLGKNTGETQNIDIDRTPTCYP
jgi:hypothetical protein